MTGERKAGGLDKADLRPTIEGLLRARAGAGGHHLEGSDVDRFEAIARHLGKPPASLLDVGCGTGVVTDVAMDLGFQAVGIDSDPTVMEHMSAPHQVASVGALPFGDATFDIVLASEILEHLPAPIYLSALAEIRRVAGQQVLLTVPNEESLESASTRCPRCLCVYSIHGHVRRFERKDLAELLTGFRLESVREIGPYKLRHRSIEWFIRRRLLGRWPPSPGTVCPQCQASQTGNNVRNRGAGRGAVTGAIRFLAGFPWRRWWLLARYERTE